MIQQKYKDLVNPAILHGAVENNAHTGFREDYHILHTLLVTFKPKYVLEIGTNIGRGTKIIKNAVPEAQVFTLDLPTELAHTSLQHPISEGQGDRVGWMCDLEFTQLRGDSLTFDFSKYPCEAYFVDGEHDYDHPYKETIEILKQKPKLIIYHDADIPSVYEAILAGFIESEEGPNYTLYRVNDTRMAYAVRTTND